MNVTVPFPWIVDNDAGQLFPLKWTGQGTRCEFYVPKLSSRAIDVLLAHCVEVKNTIEGELPEEKLCASALFNVFPRTLSKTLRQEWKQLETDSGFSEYNVHEFDEIMTEFVASYSSEQDRSYLLNQLRQPVKPREQTVQSFYSRLLELNDFVSFLPGDEDQLTDKQLKKAFYEGKPATWKERFTSSGESFAKMTRNQVVR
jgi:hypothetical protein